MERSTNSRTYLGAEGKGVSVRSGKAGKNKRDGLGRGSPAMIDDHTETICSILPDGTFGFVNDVFCRVFGKKRSQFIGKKWVGMVEEEDLERIQNQLQQLRPEIPVVVVEHRVQLGAAGPRWMQFVNRGMFDERGNLLETRVVGRDITERVEMELALKESRERWKFAIESSGDGVWDWNVATGEVKFSDRWKGMLGYLPEEILGGLEEWESRVHPDDLADAKAGLKAHFEGVKASFVQEFRMKCKDGSWKWILTRGKVIARDGKGLPLRAIGTHTDISEAKAAKAREAENLRLIAEGAPCDSVLDAIVRHVEAEHPEMYCKVMAVDHAAGVLKVRAGPRMPEWYLKAVDGAMIGEGGKCSCEAVFRGERDVTEDIRLDERWKDRRELVAKLGMVACWAEPIRSRSGLALGSLACYHREPHLPTWAEIGTVMNAVSLAAVALEREQEERALRESEGKFRAVFQQAAVGVAVLETATGRFLDVNQRMCEINGLTREEMLKTDFMALTLPEDLGGDLDQMKRLVAGEIPNFTMEKRNIRGDGQICWVNLTVSPLWQPGEPPLRHVAVLQDITGSKLAEANYRRQLEYNRALVANTSVYMVSLDSKGRFEHVNESFLKGSGYALGEILNRTPWEIGLMNKEDAMRSKERFKVVLSGVESPPIELRLKTRGGSWRVVEVRSAMTRTPDGKPDRIIVTGTDLTERNRLQQEVLNVVEREQARLGHDLHDGVGQTMTGVVALIDALEEGLNGEAKQDAARIRKLIQDGVSEMRRMSHGLSPMSVKYRGLEGSMELLAETVRLNHRTPCVCEIEEGIMIEDDDTQTHLYRIAQEAVNNALRHGNPKTIWIRLKTEGVGVSVLSVEDDGSGIKKAKGKGPKVAGKAGIGMRVMEYRANLIGAELEVKSRVGGGVVVTCRLRAPGVPRGKGRGFKVTKRG